MIESFLYCGLKTIDSNNLIINKEKTISGIELKRHRAILSIKMENPRLRENIIRYKVFNGEIKENGKNNKEKITNKEKNYS